MSTPMRSMFTHVLSGLMIWIAAVPSYTGPVYAEENAFEVRVQRCISKILPSVATVAAESATGPSFGAGFVVDQKERLVLTNFHVVSGSKRITVKFAGGAQPLQASVVRHEASRDVALLEVVDGESIPRALELKRSGSPHLGQFVVAAGSPGGYDFSASLGIVSAADRRLPEVPGDLRFLQTDAPMYHGSSGGPLVDLDGEVVGMNSRGGAEGAAAFAIPASDLGAFIESYRAEPTSGNVQFGYLGAVLQPLTDDLRAALGFRGPSGAVVAHVYEHSAAAEAGLHPGDILTKVGALNVAASSEEELAQVTSLLHGLGPKPTISLELSRNGEQRSISGRLSSVPPCDDEPIERDPISLVSHSTGATAGSCYLLPHGEFVEISRLWATRRSGIQAGDLVIELDGSSSELAPRLQALLDGAPGKSGLIRVLRRGVPKLVVIRSLSTRSEK